MHESSTLTSIMAFADRAHGEQLRRYTNERYIVHPLRVMEMCKLYTSDVTVLAAALLHDVLEDTETGRDELADFLITVMTAEEAQGTVQLVEELTDVYIKSSFPYWNRRKRKNKEAERLAKISPAAQTIKYADIIDNAPEITEMDPEFAVRYLQEYKALLKIMWKGNADLFNKAVDTIQQCISALHSKRHT